MSTLSGTGGGESPARSALALVLDRSDGALRSPVQRVCVPCERKKRREKKRSVDEVSEESVSQPLTREVSIGGAHHTVDDLVRHVRVRREDGGSLCGLVVSQKVLREFAAEGKVSARLESSQTRENVRSGEISEAVHGHGVGFSFLGIVALDGIQVRAAHRKLQSVMMTDVDEPNN